MFDCVWRAYHALCILTSDFHYRYSGSVLKQELLKRSEFWNLNFKYLHHKFGSKHCSHPVRDKKLCLSFLCVWVTDIVSDTRTTCRIGITCQSFEKQYFDLWLEKNLLLRFQKSDKKKRFPPLSCRRKVIISQHTVVLCCRMGAQGSVTTVVSQSHSAHL